MVTAFLSHGTNCITGESGEGGNGAEEGEVGFFREVFSDATGTTNNGISSSWYFRTAKGTDIRWVTVALSFMSALFILFFFQFFQNSI